MSGMSLAFITSQVWHFRRTEKIMTTSGAAKPIVVGFDGSAGADRALRWALAEGRTRGLPVYVLQIFEWPVNVASAEVAWLAERQSTTAKSDLDQAVAAAGGGADQVSIVEGPIAGMLITRSRDAAMVVLGQRGRGAFAGMLLGSVSASVAVHAACPVVVVRGEDRRGLPIVVGVDDSPQSQEAAVFAFAEAKARGCDVVVTRAWRPDGDPSGELETAERYALRQSIARAREAYPQVRWSLRLIADRPARALVEASREAQMIIVGHRGRGGFTGLLLGSTAQQLLHHAACPVVVVR